MKKSLLVALISAGLFAAAAAFAAEKEVTLTGAGQCAKCSLGKADSCQNAIVVKEDGKDVTYFMAENAVSKKFHSEICEEPKKIKVTGTVKDVAGKKEITASKIELVKG